MNILLVLNIVLSSCSSTASAQSPTPTVPSEIGRATIKLSNEGVTIAVARVLSNLQSDSLENDGKLSLPICFPPDSISIWAPRHYIRTIPCNGGSEYSETLTPILITDNVNYAWVEADNRSNSSQNCVGCHSDSQGRNEYSQWVADGHSRVFVDPYFWTIYTGSHINGSMGSETTWEMTNEGQKKRVPQPASPYGPGFRLDYPNEYGNCVFCHAPAAISGAQAAANFNSFSNSSFGNHVNVTTEGVTCDVCHKVTDILVGDDGRPFAERPGVLAFSLLRPNSGELFYIGPLTDLKPQSSGSTAACSPIFSESKFCAACHYGRFYETLIYNSYGEWLDSNYSEQGIEYRSCQDCHMPSSQEVAGTSLKARAACSGENRSFRDFSHNMMKRDNNDIPTLVQDAAMINMTATKADGKITVTVAVTNARAGHKFPTDSPLRHLILLVEAKDRKDTSLAQVEGPMIPAWGGVGNQPEDYAGRPGVIYANLLKDKDTNISPTAAYWNPTIPAWPGSDTRLMPGQVSSSVYSFVAPSNGSVSLTARLIYRYAFIDIIRQKGWPIKDVPVTSAAALVP
jgi:nitrate/TMAO reductase-like tetraheme cytochrome c subunit